MHIKNKIRSVLRDSLVKSSVSNYRDRVTNKQSVRNVILEENRALSHGLKSQTPGGLLRIWASDDKNAKEIAKLLQQHQDRLPIQSVHIANQAIGYRAKPKQEPIYNSSVIVKLSTKALLISATTTIDDISLLRTEVLENHERIKKPQRLLIDYSSPNIAKPFHFGHLKSTLLGNFLANINQFLGNSVTKLNYIGDWGTQYGILSLGLETFGNVTTSIKEAKESISTLKQLLNVYVQANEQGKKDDEFYQEAKRRYLAIQNETDPNLVSKWREIRELSLYELGKSYSRLGIEFDVFEYESDYAKKSTELVRQTLKLKNFVKAHEDGAMVAQLDRYNKIFEVPLIRSDGASLYIARDVAAAISRREKFVWDKMYYVVGADQEKHFYSLKEILRKLGHEWWNDLIHVKMGKVLNMSSRSGNSVLLSDLIDEATNQYIKSTKNTPTSKVANEQLEEVGKHLALSALFIYDMRNARTRNYEFDWDLVMLPSTRSGINLQTTLARLSSLLEKTSQAGLHPTESPEELDPDAICSEEGMNLLTYLDELDSELHSSYWSMDPNPLVDHALGLCKAINRARQSERLLVLGESNEKWARTRLKLFKSSHAQLEFIIRLIGLKPLYKV